MKRKEVISWLKGYLDKDAKNLPFMRMLIADFKDEFPKKEKVSPFYVTPQPSVVEPTFDFQSVIPILPKFINIIPASSNMEPCLSNDVLSWVIVEHVKEGAIGEIGAYLDGDGDISFEEFHYNSDFGSDMNDTFGFALDNLLERG